MNLTDVYALKAGSNIDGLLNAIYDEDEYVRSAAAQALGGFPDGRVKEVLSRVKFDDPVVRVRDTAARSHERVVESLMEQKL